MTITPRHPELTAEEKATVKSFIEKRPDIYQRWLANRQARRNRQAQLLKRVRASKP